MHLDLLYSFFHSVPAEGPPYKSYELSSALWIRMISTCLGESDSRSFRECKCLQTSCSGTLTYVIMQQKAWDDPCVNRLLSTFIRIDLSTHLFFSLRLFTLALPWMYESGAPSKKHTKQENHAPNRQVTQAYVSEKEAASATIFILGFDYNFTSYDFKQPSKFKQTIEFQSLATYS